MTRHRPCCPTCRTPVSLNRRGEIKRHNVDGRRCAAVGDHWVTKHLERFLPRSVAA